MALQLTEEVIALLQSNDTVKILATTNKQGEPHITVKQSLHFENGNIVFFELLESSQTYRNLTHSIWFNRKVAITVLGRDRENYQIKGTPIKNIIAGKFFEEQYRKVREKIPNADLAAIWLIRPEEVINQQYLVRKADADSKHPFFVHLDQLKNNEGV